MTTGSYTIGTESSYFFDTKTWSGADGSKTYYYKVDRPAHKVGKIVRVKDSFGRTLYRYRVERYVPARVRVLSKRSNAKWNSYSMSARRSTRQKSVNGILMYDYYAYNFLSVDSNEFLKLLSRLADRVRGHSYNLAVSNAQIGLTLDMISSTAARIARSIRSLKHGNITDAARHLGVSPRSGSKHARPVTTRDMADAWLELQYGWSPLLQDVHDAAQALAVNLNPPNQIRHTVTYPKGDDVKEIYPDPSIAPAIYQSYCQRTARTSIIVVLQEQLSLPRQLGLLDPASVAWEVLPFSFICDWFIPIGTYLDDLSIIPSITGKFLVTEVRKNVSSRRGMRAYYAGASTDMSAVQMSRGSQTGLPIPKPEFNIPKISGTNRLWNSLALLRQVVA